MVIGQLNLELEISDVGSFDVLLKTMYAPRTLLRIEKILPVSVLALKQDKKIVLSLENIAAPAEYQQKVFKRGDISFDPSSNNMYIHLENINMERSVTLLGNISSSLEDFVFENSKHVVLKIKEIPFDS